MNTLGRYFILGSICFVLIIITNCTKIVLPKSGILGIVLLSDGTKVHAASYYALNRYLDQFARKITEKIPNVGETDLRTQSRCAEETEYFLFRNMEFGVDHGNRIDQFRIDSLLVAPPRGQYSVLDSVFTGLILADDSTALYIGEIRDFNPQWSLPFSLEGGSIQVQYDLNCFDNLSDLLIGSSGMRNCHKVFFHCDSVGVFIDSIMDFDCH